MVSWSQDVNAQAAAIAEREAAEERYKRLNAAIEDLLASQTAQQKRINALADEIRALRDELPKFQGNWATHDDLRRLAQKAQEIDEKREADRKLILDELQKLLRTPLVAAPQPPLSSPPPTKSPPSASPGSSIEKGYEHTVESGQSLSIIMQAYRDKGVKVSLKQVLEANPGLDPNRLRVGQRVFIPDPSK